MESRPTTSASFRLLQVDEVIEFRAFWIAALLSAMIVLTAVHPSTHSFAENAIEFAILRVDSTDHRDSKLASLSAGGQEKDRVLVPQNWKPKN